MTPSALARLGLTLLACAGASPLLAADKVIGTFTVAGRTTRFSQIYATLEKDAASADREYLMLLVSDAPVAPEDRTPERLAALAKAGSIRAIRMRWTYGTDSLAVIPYHAGVADSGLAFEHLATIDLTRLDQTVVDAGFKSKMVGQDWHFNAYVKAAIVKGTVAILEPDVETSRQLPTADAAPAGNATALKRQLGSLGYEFKPDAFFNAIGTSDAPAVQLFLQAGMSPNQQNAQHRFALNHAVLGCGADPVKAAAVIAALLSAKADVRTKDPDNKTTPLVGAVQSCPADTIAALVSAGSDLRAKSAGGMTALQLAEVFQRQDVAALLRKAGAH